MIPWNKPVIALIIFSTSMAAQAADDHDNELAMVANSYSGVTPAARLPTCITIPYRRRGCE